MIKSFDGKCRILKTKSVYLIGTVAFAAIVTTLNRLTVYEGVLGLCYAVFLFVFSLIFLRGTLLKKLFISILTLVCLVSTASLAGNILLAIYKNDPMKKYVEHSFERFAFIVIGVAFLMYALTICSQFTRTKKDSVKPKEWILILSVLGISFFAFLALHSIILSGFVTNEHIKLLMASEIGIIFINIICLSIMVNLNETHAREEQLIIDKKRSEYNQNYAKTIKEQYEQTRRLRHDMKQYSVTLLSLIKDRKLELAETLVKTYTENLSHIETVINVDNEFINAILNSKLSFAKAEGIDIFCSIDKNISGIEDIDLCNLIGNLLDNAITAAKICDYDSRLIEVTISSVRNKLIVIIKNSIKSSVLTDNPDLKSTKQNSLEHGFGVKTIKYIAEKYNGTFDFFEEDLTFVSRVEMHKV